MKGGLLSLLGSPFLYDAEERERIAINQVAVKPVESEGSSES